MMEHNYKIGLTVWIWRVQLGDQDGKSYEICYSFHTALLVYLKIVYNYEFHDSFVITKPHSGPKKQNTKNKIIQLLNMILLGHWENNTPLGKCKLHP